MKEKHLHMIRVAIENWESEERFEHLLRLLEQYPCGITQVALFTACTHSPMQLEELSRRVKILQARLERLQRTGLSGGINHLPTIGHHCEDLDVGLGNRYTYMTNIEGEVCLGCYCMRDPDFLEEYVAPSYAMLAEAKPEFIWIDDDIRYYHMPVGNGCFCDRCIEAFNQRVGGNYTRETLRQALNRQDVALRKAWLDHNSEAITNLFRVIEKAVRGIDPSIKLGFMTGERYNEGYQFKEYADALSDGGKYEVFWRPGGGVYTDYSYEETLEKQQQMGRQNAYLPDYVTVIQSEIENFPYQLLKKTPKSTALEAAMSMTVGCTGAAFNILPSETGESLDTIVPHLRAINRLTAFYKKTQDLLAGLTPEGIHTGWHIDSQAAVPEGEFSDLYGGMYGSYNRELFYFGLPECYRWDKARAVTLTGTAAAVLDDRQIAQMLSGGVYMDAPALEYLRKRGFADQLGFCVDREIPVDAREVYTEHALNEGFVGGLRNCRQAFYFGDSFVFTPQAEACQSICALVDYHGRRWGDCSCGIYENDLGGRVCAAGYYPHSWICDYQKTIQLKRLFVWLSRGTLPSFVESYHRVRNITLTGNGRTCVTLFNCSNDDLDKLLIAVRTEKQTAQLHTMFDGVKTLWACRSEVLCGNTYQYFEIDRIAAYEGVIVEI